MFKRTIPFLIAAIVFFSLILITNPPSTDLFELEHIDYVLFMQPDGTANVSETFTMRFKKPFRYVTWALDMPEDVTLENVQYELLQGPPLLGGVREKKIGPSGVEFIFQFTHSMEEYLQPPPGGVVVRIKISYDVKNLLVQGRDFTQLFVKYLGEAPTTAKVLDVRVVFPLEFGEPKIFHHPWGLQTSSSGEGRIKRFVFRNVPADCFVEGRYIFTEPISVQHVRHQDVSLREVLSYERGYLLKNILGVVFAASYTMFVVLFPFYIHRKLGKEFSIVYDAEYEREVPYNDPPEVVNGVVKRLCSTPDEHGLNSLLLKAVKEKKARFISDQKGEISGIEFLPGCDEAILKIFSGFLQNRKLDFESFKKAVQKESNATKFLNNYRDWQQKVLKQIREKHLMDERGNKIAKSFAVIFAILIPFVVFLVMANLDPGFEPLAGYVRILMFLCISVGTAILSMRKDVFSRWTEKGLLYYLRWKNFEKFLLDFSALSSHPPESVAIWDDYIVYATALGIAKKVAENFRKLNPPSESSVASVVVVQPRLLDSVPTIVTTASHTVSKSSSSSSGGFSGGRVGSGAGGSRIGAG